MNKLLTRILFVSLLLSTTILPVTQKKSSNRWKLMAKRTALFGEGVLGGAIMGRVVGYKIGSVAGANAGMAVAFNLAIANNISITSILQDAFCEGKKKGAEIGGLEGTKIGVTIGGIIGILVGQYGNDISRLRNNRNIIRAMWR